MSWRTRAIERRRRKGLWGWQMEKGFQVGAEAGWTDCRGKQRLFLYLPSFLPSSLSFILKTDLPTADQGLDSNVDRGTPMSKTVVW